MQARNPSPESVRGAANGRARWGQVLLFLWAAGLVVVLGALMAGHWTTLPKPAAGDRGLAERLACVRDPRATSATWAAFHVLYAECNCSAQVLDHLVASERPGDLDETVLLVGEHEAFAARCRANGLRVVRLTQEQLECDFGIVAAPILLVTDERRQLVYSGGYADRSRGFAMRDLEIVQALRAGRDVAALPVFGCGVSRALQNDLDPLGLKY